MSYFLDRLQFIKRSTSTFVAGHGATRGDDRNWKNPYRARGRYDYIVCATHGVNRAGPRGWKIRIKKCSLNPATRQTPPCAPVIVNTWH